MRFAEKTKCVLVLAAVCVMWAEGAQGLTVPMDSGNKWVYTDHTITIMKQENHAGEIWSGFTALPLPDVMPEGTWEEEITWDEVVSNWMRVDDSSCRLLLKDRTGDVPSVLLDVSQFEGQQWDPSLPGVSGAVYETVHEQEARVPAGTFNDCWLVQSVNAFTRCDNTKNVNYEIKTYTWYADGIGVVKDSVCVRELPDCDVNVHVSKLVRYEFQ
jgi:hypothetical protein